MPAQLRRTATRASVRSGSTAVALALVLTLPAQTAMADQYAPKSFVGTAPMAGAATPEELEAQRERAERLQADVVERGRKLTEARDNLQELSAQSQARLAAHQEASEQRDAAELERRDEFLRLAGARTELSAQREALGRWASTMYRSGVTLAEYEAIVTILESENTDDVSQRLAMLERVGRSRGSAVEDYAAAEREQAAASAAAEAAAELAAEKVEAAQQSQEAAESAVDEQNQQLEALQRLLRDTKLEAADAAALAAQLEEQVVVAEQQRMALAASTRTGVDNGVTGEVGECEGGDVASYPNGQISLTALCELETALGHRLRPDAAYAYDRLSRAYQEETGGPLCITDSYRALGSQVRLFSTKPGLAAVPGTSNHGWGTAVDLCGGIESFGTPAHSWMVENAPLYGYFHPLWAQIDGSRPEPWHWEFGG